MINCAFYPVLATTIPVVRFINQGSSLYRITTLLSFPGSGLDGHDGGEADNGVSVGIKVVSDIHCGLDNWECLLIADSTNEFGTDDDDDVAMHIILQAIESKKAVICVRHLLEDDVCFFKKLASIKGVQFQYMRNAESKEPINRGPLKAIPSFVVLFGGVLKDPRVFETFLTSFLELSRVNNVIAFSTDLNAPLCGINPLAPCLRNTLSEQDKIYSINAQIARCCKNEHPRIILIHVSEPLVAYSELIPNGFGIVPFLLSKALKIDCCICGIPFSLCSTEFIHNLSCGLLAQNGYSVDAAILSNLLLDIPISIEKESTSVTYIPYSELENDYTIFNTETIPVYNTQNNADFLALCENIHSSSEAFYSGVQVVE